jgi:hypothetical protein
MKLSVKALFARKPPAASFIESPKFRANEPFLEFLAFGARFSEEPARFAVERFATQKRDWSRSRAEPDWHAATDAAKHAFMRELLAEIIADVIARIDPRRPLTLGLSSGLDSRTILHFMRRAGVRPQTYSWGTIGHCDFDIARLLAARLSLDTIFFDTNSIVFEPAAMNSPYAMTFARIAVLRRLNEDFPGRIELHGYLGDALTGAHLPERASATWPRAVRRFGSRNDTFYFQQFLPGVARDLLARKPFVTADELQYDHQLDLGYRQAQRIRPGTLPDQRPIIFPFEDPRWVGFWLNRGAADTHGRRLILKFARSLNSEEFFELAEFDAELQAQVKEERIRFLYGGNGRSGLIDLSQATGAQPALHAKNFCLFATFQNNPDFRRTVLDSLARQRRRGVFAPSFVDSVWRKFEARELRSLPLMYGLIATDFLLEHAGFE